MKKRIIFHIPLKLDSNLKSASQIRPKQMIRGFKDAGFEVDIVEGDSKERSDKIKYIKKQICKGIKYSFMYSESSTMPTMLTSRHHLPTHPFLDLELFNLCKKKGIKVGLFYRDIYWAFPEYGRNIKDRIAKIFYRIDLMIYNKYVDVLFLPSLRMKEFIPCNMKMPLYALPSGAEVIGDDIDFNAENDVLEVFYVGGIGNHYNLTLLCECIAKLNHIHLTICCRPKDWETVENIYKPLLGANIDVVHASGSELDYYYKRADLCSLFVKPGVYRAFAMPYKLLEFIGRGRPVLASTGTATADFVKTNKVGFCIDYSEHSLLDFLNSITKSNLSEMRNHILNVARTNSWQNRALEVAELLDC